MKSKSPKLAMIAGAAALAIAGSAGALASGPGNTTGNGNGSTGRAPMMITCDGTDYTVVVPLANNANGAGQIVDKQGHGIPVSGTFMAVDETTSATIFSGPFGHAGHQNQEQTECKGTAFDGLASDFFGTQLPTGVAASDHIVATLDVFVVLKP